MQKFDFYKFLCILSLILATISMLLAFCGRARAEGMDQYYRQYLHQYFGDGFTSEQWSYIEGVMDECPYFITFQTTDGSKKAVAFTSYSSYYTYDDIYGSNDLTVPDLEIQITYNNVGYSLDLGARFGRLCPFSIGDIHSSSNDNPYRWFCFGIGQETNAIGLIVIPSSMMYDDSSTWHCRWYDSSRRSISGFDSHSIANWDYDPSLVYCNFNARVIRGSYTITEIYEQNVSIPEYLDASDDIDIDKTYVDGALGIRVKWSVLPFPESGSFNYAGYTSITLDFDCDGTVVSVTLDSDDYPELFSNYDTSLPNNGSAYIPWSMVQKVKRLLQYADYDVISCTGCSITMSGYPSGSPSSAASEYTMVAVKNPPLVLKGQSYVETPEFDAASVLTAADRPTSVEEGSTYQSNAFSYAHSFFYSSSDFSIDDIPICSWADYKIVVFDNPTSSSEEDLSDDIVDALPSPINPVRGFLDKDYFNSLISKFGIMIPGVTNNTIDIVDISSGNPSSLTYSDVLSLGLDDLLHDNSFSSYFDILIFVYHSDQDYVCVYYSDRYFTRLQFRAFEDLQTVLEADAYYMKNTYLLLDAVVTNIDSNLVDFFTSSLDVDSKMLFYLDSMNIKFDDLDRSITSGTASIVAALNDLDTFDDTRIYNKLVELTGYIQALQTADSVNNSNTTILGQILAAINDIEYPDSDTAPDWVSALLEFLGDLLDLLNSLSSDGITVTLSDSNEPDTPQEYGFNLEIPDWSFSDSGFSVDQASLSGYEDDPIMQQLITELASDFFDKLKPVSYQLLDLMYENIEFDEDDDYDDSFTNANIAHFFGGYRRPAAGGEASSFFFFFTDQYDPYEYDGIVQNE